MTATDKTSCISHRQNIRFFVMFGDFLEVAGVSEHQYKLAAFWRVLETKTNERILFNDEKKIANTEEHLWIEIPYSEFVSRSLGTYKSSAFQIAAAESERLGFSKGRVRKRPVHKDNPDSPLEDYKEYYFCTEVLQSVLNGGEYPPPIENNSPLLKSIAIRKEKKAIENNGTPIENNTSPLLKSTEGAIENNRKKYSKVSSKYKRSKESTSTIPTSPIPSSHDEDAHALLSSQEERTPHGSGNSTLATHSIAALHTPTDYSSGRDNHSLGRLDRQTQNQIAQERTSDGHANSALVHPSLANGQSIHPHTESPATANVPPGLGGIDPLRAQMEAREQDSLIASTTPATSRPESKRAKKASSKPALPIEEVALRKEVQAWVDKERGFSLRGRAPKEQIFAEQGATETLAHMLYVRRSEGKEQEGCEWADLIYVRAYCAKQDKYWSKPENRVRLGSYAILQQFNVALALRQAEVLSPGMASIHVVGGRQETPLQRRNREMREKYGSQKAVKEVATHGA